LPHKYNMEQYVVLGMRRKKSVTFILTEWLNC
jgi:hypothetical protein